MIEVAVGMGPCDIDGQAGTGRNPDHSEDPRHKTFGGLVEVLWRGNGIRDQSAGNGDVPERRSRRNIEERGISYFSALPP